MAFAGIIPPSFSPIAARHSPTDWRFRVALVLAHEEGHRIGAIRHLRWSDIDLEGWVLRWRAEHEKTGYEHRRPVTVEAMAFLHEARQKSSGHEDAPVLPAPRDGYRREGGRRG